MSESRIYIVFRADLPEMTRAKGEVQAAHAVGSLIYDIAAFNGGVTMLADYMTNGNPFAPDGIVTEGQMKVIMEVNGLEDLRAVKQRADKRGVSVIMIQDAAHTIFPEPTVTCLAFGPCSKTDGNAITRGARMRA